MPKQRPGFTIVELMIAVAVMVVILALAIPRFSSFSQQQDYLSRVNALAECLRQAEQLAAAPSGPLSAGASLRYTSADFTLAPAGGTVSCQVTEYPSADKNRAPLTIASLTGQPNNINTEQPFDAVSSDNLALPQITLDNTLSYNTSALQSFKVYYGALEGGLPLAFSCVAIPGLTNPCASPYQPTPAGQGMALSLQVQDQGGTALSGSIIQSKLGIPVQYQAD